MKHVLSTLIVMSLIVFLGATAQTDEESRSEEKNQTIQAAADPTAMPSSSGGSKAERVYPIAPGVWYPGQEEPKKPFRYYRVRCWPGCHHASPYGKYPDQPIPGEPDTETQDSEPHAAQTGTSEAE